MENICHRAQVWLDHHYSIGHSIALRYFTKECEGRINRTDFNANVDRDLLAHVKECNECSVWIKERVGPQIFERQRRLTEYCCPVLFGAVEEPNRDNLKIDLSPQYQLDGGQNWKLALASETRAETYLIINFCPFCGERVKIPESKAL